MKHLIFAIKEFSIVAKLVLEQIQLEMDKSSAIKELNTNIMFMPGLFQLEMSKDFAVKK